MKKIILLLLVVIMMASCKTHVSLCDNVLSRRTQMGCNKTLGNDKSYTYITMTPEKDGAHFMLYQKGGESTPSSQMVDMYWGGTTNKVEITLFGTTIENTVVFITDKNGVSSYSRPGDIGPKVNDHEIARFEQIIRHVMKELSKNPCE